MTPRILIAGGYGLIGSAIARRIRNVTKDVAIVLAGRHPEQGEALARELGGATAQLDVRESGALEKLGHIDLIVAALYDPANTLLHGALRHGIAHIGITTKADDVAPVISATLASPPKRPIVLAGYCAAGVLTLVAPQAARQFSRVDTIEATAVFDARDPVGPMTANDAEHLIARALLRQSGSWTWVDGSRHARPIQLASDQTLQGYPTALLDVPGLAAITGAANVRLDIVQGDSLGTRRGGPASSDASIDIQGLLTSGKPGKSRTTISDPKGLAHLTALGVLVATERVLGLDGRTAASGGLYLPETLVSPQAAIARFEAFGVRIITETESACSRAVA
jgi:hypothetical protein